MRAIFRCAWGPLLFFTVGQCAIITVYRFAGVAPSELAWTLQSSSGGLAFASWVVADAHLQGRTPCCDFGLFNALTMPLVPIWYVFHTRGWRGLLTVAGLLLATWAPTVYGELIRAL